MLSACEAGSAMHKVEPGTFSVNIKNIAFVTKHTLALMVASYLNT